jgi:hypothetical protein
MSSVRSIIKTTKLIGVTTGVNPALVSGDMSANIIGPITNIDKIDQVCYDVSWTSSNAVGVISIQGCVSGQDADFKDLTFNPVLTQPASNNGGYLINLALIPFPFIRLKYTRTSGTGSLVVFLSAKGF